MNKESVVIECLLQRKGGTRIELPGPEGRPVPYHFKPEQDDGPHIAKVGHPPHIKRLLGIPEAYRLVAGELPELATVADIVPVVTAPAAVKASPDADPFDDLANLAVDTLSNTELERFAVDVMGLENPKDKAAVIEFAKRNFELDISKKTGLADAIREVAKRIVQEEREADAFVEGGEDE